VGRAVPAEVGTETTGVVGVRGGTDVEKFVAGTVEIDRKPIQTRGERGESKQWPESAQRSLVIAPGQVRRVF